MVLRHGVGDGLQQHRFTGTWRRDDQTTLTLAERRHQVDDTRGEVLRGRLHLQLLFRIQRSEIVEEYFFARLIRRFEVDSFDFDQCKISFTFFGWTNLAANGVAGAQVKLANL